MGLYHAGDERQRGWVMDSFSCIAWLLSYTAPTARGHEVYAMGPEPERELKRVSMSTSFSAHVHNLCPHPCTPLINVNARGTSTRIYIYTFNRLSRIAIAVIIQPRTVYVGKCCIFGVENSSNIRQIFMRNSNFMIPRTRKMDNYVYVTTRYMIFIYIFFKDFTRNVFKYTYSTGQIRILYDFINKYFAINFK